MSEALVTVPQEEPQGLAEVVDLGKIFHQSGMFPSNKSAAQAVVKILAGRELGFGPIASMQGIQMIQGRPTLSANMMAALVKRSGRYDFRVRQNSEEVCSIEFYDRGEAVGFSTFTKQDAAKAGLLGGDNWRKYFRNMASLSGRDTFQLCIFGGSLPS